MQLLIRGVCPRFSSSCILMLALGFPISWLKTRVPRNRISTGDAASSGQGSRSPGLFLGIPRTPTVCGTSLRGLLLGTEEQGDADTRHGCLSRNTRTSCGYELVYNHDYWIACDCYTLITRGPATRCCLSRTARCHGRDKWISGNGLHGNRSQRRSKKPRRAKARLPSQAFCSGTMVGL